MKSQELELMLHEYRRKKILFSPLSSNQKVELRSLRDKIHSLLASEPLHN